MAATDFGTSCTAAPETACAGLPASWHDLAGLHIALPIAAADLAKRSTAPPPSCTPDRGLALAHLDK